MSGAEISVNDVSRMFKLGDEEIWAVRDINLKIEKGEFVALIGRSGSGKTTLLNLIAGLDRPSEGSVVIDGERVDLMNESELVNLRRKKLGFVFQSFGLLPLLSAYENVELPLRISGKKGRDRTKRTNELLDLVGIPSPEDRVKDYPHQLSGGMQQRAMIAMAIACNPELLIADEPSTALDVTIQAQVIELLGELREKLNMAVILITHDLALVAGFCDEVAVMYAGYIVEQGPARDIFYNPQHPYTLGLLGSVPDLKSSREEKLEAIPGVPPDMLALPPGCPYAERCSFVRDECRTVVPELQEVGTAHTIRCIVDVKSGALR